MKQNLLTYILTLIIVFLCAFSSKGKDIQITKVYELQKDYNVDRRDTTLLITLQVPFIKIGTQTYVGSKRNTSFSEDTIYDEFKVKDGTVITLHLDPDTGNILQVCVEGKQNFYYKP